MSAKVVLQEEFELKNATENGKEQRGPEVKEYRVAEPRAPKHGVGKTKRAHGLAELQLAFRNKSTDLNNEGKQQCREEKERTNRADSGEGVQRWVREFFQIDVPFKANLAQTASKVTGDFSLDRVLGW